MSNSGTEKFIKITSLEELSEINTVLLGAEYNYKTYIASTNYSASFLNSIKAKLDPSRLVKFNENMLLLNIEYDTENNKILFSYNYIPVEGTIIVHYLAADYQDIDKLKSTTELGTNCYFVPEFINGQLYLTCADENVTHNKIKFDPSKFIFNCCLPDDEEVNIDLYKSFTGEEPVLVPTDLQNHVIDPTFFYDAILEFAFNYYWYPVIGYETDELKRKVAQFDQQIINGSLQPQTSSIDFKVSGNTQTLKYKFYCKSLYRINHGDFIYYKNRYLHVDEVQDYDEWGVREVSLTMVNLTDYRDFRDYLKYLKGDISV